jgi:hypothetical protein
MCAPVLRFSRKDLDSMAKASAASSASAVGGSGGGNGGAAGSAAASSGVGVVVLGQNAEVAKVTPLHTAEARGVVWEATLKVLAKAGIPTAAVAK